MKSPLIGLLAVKNQLITKEELEIGLQQCAGLIDLKQELKDYFLAKELVSAQNIEQLTRAAKTQPDRRYDGGSRVDDGKTTGLYS